MKKIKNTVFALLSATALLFSSCLGDSEYTPSIGCTGTPMGTMGSQVMLDNGVIVSLSGTDPTALMNVDRVYVLGQLAGEDAKLEAINPGDEVTIIPQALLKMEEINSTGQAADEEEAFEGIALSPVHTFNWFAVYGSIFNGLNGYMNFTLNGDFYQKKAESSQGSNDNGGNSYTTITPRCYMYVSRIDKDAKIVDLVFGYDNREAECVDESGKLKEGYVVRENTDYMPLYFNVRSLYTEFADLADEDMITFNAYTVTRDKDGKLEKEKVNLSYASIPKSALKRTYGGY